jgi:hypothetical protein
LHLPGPAHRDDDQFENPPADGAVVAQRDAKLVGVLGLRSQIGNGPRTVFRLPAIWS